LNQTIENFKVSQTQQQQLIHQLAKENIFYSFIVLYL